MIFTLVEEGIKNSIHQPGRNTMNLKKVFPAVTLFILSSAIAMQSPLKAEPIVRRTSEIETQQPTNKVPSQKAMLLVKGSGPEVFLIQDGERRWITDSKTFDEYGFDYDEVKEIFDEELDDYPEGTPITKNGTLLRGSDSEVYIIINGTRRLVRESVFKQNQFRREDINFVTDNNLFSIPEGPVFQ